MLTFSSSSHSSLIELVGLQVVLAKLFVSLWACFKCSISRVLYVGVNFVHCPRVTRSAFEEPGLPQLSGHLSRAKISRHQNIHFTLFLFWGAVKIGMIKSLLQILLFLQFLQRFGDLMGCWSLEMQFG